MTIDNSCPLEAGAPRKLVLYGVEAVFRYCPSGTFMMGSPESDPKRLHDETPCEVTLTRGFWLLETPVTQALWKAATGENPSYFQGADARPVERASWDACADFVRRLNVGGLAPDGLKFDFPTEAEWEYACRAGTTTRYHFGDRMTLANANYGSRVGETSPVRSYSPNAWGFYDMHGNVDEWCSDRYGKLPSGTATDPVGASEGRFFVLRGGGWNSDAKYCRSASRNYTVAWDAGHSLGFRLALRAAE